MRWPTMMVITVFMAGPAALATTYVVHPDGTGDFPTIQTAIDAAEDGDIIELTDGTFTGEGNRDIDYLGKAITVRSQSGNPETCIIDCEGSEGDPHRGFCFHSGEDAESIVEGVTIANGYVTGGYPGPCCGGAVATHGSSSPTLVNCRFLGNQAEAGGGVHCEYGCPSFVECVFTDNAAWSGGGVFCGFEGTPSLDRCTFLDNSATNGSGGGLAFWEPSTLASVSRCIFHGNSASMWGGAVFLTNSADATIIGCTIVSNCASDGGGVSCWNSSSARIENTIIAFGTGGASVTCTGGGYADLSCSDVFGNTGGNWIGCIADQYGLDGNICEDPLFCDPAAEDFQLREDSPCAPFSPPNPECDLIGAYGVGCAPHIYVVRPDGSGDFPTIQAAIDVVVDGDIIELTDGTFTGEGNRDIDFLGKAITLRSQNGDPDSCVIDCQYEGRGFLFQSGEDSTSVLSGVTIANGYIIYEGHGGGIYCDGASPTITNCAIVSNVVGEDGGGIYLASSSATISDCTFSGNTAFGDGGGLYFEDSGSELTGCTVSSNSAHGDGGGIYYVDSDPSILECSVSGNTASGSGGGCYFDGAPLRLEGFPVTGNRAGASGGGIYSRAGLTVISSTFTGNTAQSGSGGAIAHDTDSSLVLTGCAFDQNSADGEGNGGAVWCSSVCATDGVFSRNAAGSGGGAISCTGESSFSGCTFDCDSAGVYGGAVRFSGGAVTFSECTFANNYVGRETNAFGGAASIRYASCSMANCTFFANTADGNSSDRGGAMHFYRTDPDILNCTLSGNAGDYAGSICCHDSNPLLRNTIIAFGMEGRALRCEGSSVPALTCCNIFGNSGGDWVGCIAGQYGLGGNISEDPWFCDPSSGDFTLHADSPCAPFMPPNEECDLIGAWPVGCGPMGLPGDQEPATDRLFLSAAPNPFTARTRILLSVPTCAGDAAQLSIHDPGGRLVRTLGSGLAPDGAHTIAWDGRDEAGNPVGSGIYFLQLRAGEQELTRRLLLVR